MTNDDPRIFKPEVEQQRHMDDVIRGIRNADGTMRTDPAPPTAVGGGVGFTFTMVLLPLITVLLASIAWIGAFAGYSPQLREALVRFLPDGWVATSLEGGGSPLAVGVALGAVVLVALIGMLLARRGVARVMMETSGVPAFAVSLGVFAISALMVLMFIMTPGILLVGTSIATGADLASTPLPDDATVRSWPLVLTAAAMTWFALGSTRRSWRKRAALRAATY